MLSGLRHGARTLQNACTITEYIKSICIARFRIKVDTPAGNFSTVNPIRVRVAIGVREKVAKPIRVTNLLLLGIPTVNHGCKVRVRVTKRTRVKVTQTHPSYNPPSSNPQAFPVKVIQTHSSYNLSPDSNSNLTVIHRSIPKPYRLTRL
jgi:hypothetical protein